MSRTSHGNLTGRAASNELREQREAIYEDKSTEKEISKLTSAIEKYLTLEQYTEWLTKAPTMGFQKACEDKLDELENKSILEWLAPIDAQPCATCGMPLQKSPNPDVTILWCSDCHTFDMPATGIDGLGHKEGCHKGTVIHVGERSHWWTFGGNHPLSGRENAYSYCSKCFGVLSLDNNTAKQNWRNRVQSPVS